MELYKYTHMCLEVIMWWITRVDERLAPSLTCCACLEPFLCAIDLHCSFTCSTLKESNDSGPKWLAWKICFDEEIGKAPQGLAYMVKSTRSDFPNQIYSNGEWPPDSVWIQRGDTNMDISARSSQLANMRILNQVSFVLMACVHTSYPGIKWLSY